MIRQNLSSMLHLSSMLRAAATVAVILCLSIAGLADTIRLRDGSVIRGEVVGFGDGQFTVLIGSGARGRRSRITLFTEDVESIEFDSANVTTATSEPSFREGSSTTNTRPATQTRTDTAEPAASTANTPNTSTAPVLRTPIFNETTIRVRADNTTNGWTNSGIVVRQGQRLRISASGRVTLGQNRASTPTGIRTLADSGKLMRDEATGALIAVIGDNNDDFIFIGARREFTAQRDGVLFLGVNEANLSDNTGSYEVVVGYETP